MKIEVRHLCKEFGAVEAVSGVSFGVKEGELLGLLGPSGSGKTTVLRMIAGLETPTSGDILIDGVRVNDLPVQQRNIGFVFQHYALFKHLTVFHNIAFGLKIKKWPQADIAQRVAELLRLMSLEGLGERYPHQLSGGQRQRVAIARALAPRPSVLLLDEPFGAVDAKVRQELREWLIRLHDNLNVTSLFVTHDQEEAMEVSGRILVFSKGRLEQVGTPPEVYQRPGSRFVADFVGSSNVLSPAFAAHHGGASKWTSLRPETIRVIRKDDPVPAAQAHADGEIKMIGYHGSVTRVNVEAEGLRITAEMPAEGACFKEGERVRLIWPSAAMVALEDGA